ncbi:MAG TPA: calcium-binding protein [Allosphingosinicella sp.]|nr:calcium-binding protein [Allosphingosinicella sp.]
MNRVSLSGSASLEGVSDAWTGGSVFSPTSGLAGWSQIAPLASGGFVLLYWDSAVPTLRGQVYSASGTALGTPFEVVAPGDGNLHEATVEGLPCGGFLVTYSKTLFHPDEEPGEDLFLQRFDAVGNEVGQRVQVNTVTDGHQSDPSIAVLANGDFVVIWNHWQGNWPDQNGAIRAQRFSAEGDKLGGEFVVTPQILLFQNSPRIEALDGGGFIALWAEEPSSGQRSFRARIFDADGQSVGDVITLVSSVQGYPGDPRIAVLEDGNFVLVWNTTNGYNDPALRTSELKAQLFDPGGAALGDIFRISTETAGDRQQATVSALEDGGFAVVWQDDSGDDSGYAVLGRIFDHTGAAAGDAFLVNVATAEDQRNPVSTVLSWGGIAVAWDDTGGATPGNSATLHGRIYSPGTFDAADDQVEAIDPGIATGSLFADNGFGADLVPAAGTPIVSAVNGAEAAVGREIQLSSGAVVTVHSDGRYLYDPSGAFILPDPGSGGSTVGTDSFTYSLASGDTATVNVTVRGRWTDSTVVTGSAGNDELTGTAASEIFDAGAGADRLSGAGGDDLYHVDDDGDQVIELADGGTDGVISKVWLYTLPEHVEILLGTDPRGQGLYGNMLANIIKGGVGDDGINDSQGGDDRLYGGDGHDGISVMRYDSHSASFLRLDGGAGHDVLTYSGSRYVDTVTMIGGQGDDHISAFRGGSVVIDAGAGDDRIGLNFLGAHYAITLGSGRDLLSLSANIDDRAGGTITVADFSVGDAGDRLELLHYLHSVVTGWDGESNLFATGHLRLVQDRADALLQIDADGAGSAAGYVDLVRFANADAAAFTHFNLGGFPANGGAPATTAFAGTPDRDVLWGSFADDVIEGLAGDDEIRGGAGDDRIEGGDGRDWLDGQLGDDVLLGGGGDDDLNDSMGGDDSLSGGEGGDRLHVERGGSTPASSVVLNGDGGMDVLRFTAFSRTIDTVALAGGAGNDDLYVSGGGTISVNGGDGDDYVHIDFSLGLYSITLGGGYDQVYLGRFVAPGGASTRLTIADFAPGVIGPQTDVLFLRDYLQAALPGWNGQSDLIQSGHLRLVQIGADVQIRIDSDGFAGPGDARDFVHLTGLAAASLTAYNLNDFTPSILHYEGTAAADLLTGSDRSDRIDGLAGADQMSGGLGDDLYFIDSSADSVIEAANGGTDTIATSVNYVLASGVHVERMEAAGTGALHLRGNDFANVMTGNAAANRLEGLGGNDSLNGGAGQDWLDGGAGADRLSGGSGDDRYVVDSSDSVFELNGEGNDIVYARTSFTLTAGAVIELLAAYEATATTRIDLNGNELNNNIQGNADDNTLRGMAGNDWLTGLTGHDWLDGGEGSDVLVGGLGNDRYYVDAADRVTERAGEGNDVVYARTSFVLNAGSHVELLTAISTAGTDRLDLTGNELANTIQGNDGVNVLRGGGGSDYLVSFAGNDILDGGADDDRLLGLNGDDWLDGGAGKDRLEGGAGADVFTFASTLHSAIGAADQIMDFVSGTDRIDLSAIDAIAGTAANNAFTFIGNAAFSNVAGELRVQTVGSQAHIFGDTNGDGLADFQIVVANSPIVAVGDFIL